MSIQTPTNLEIYAYLTNKHANDQYALNSINQKTPEELRKIYNQVIYRDTEEQQVLEEGITTYRINYRKEDERDIRAFMLVNNMYTYYDDTYCSFHSKFDYNCSPGNNCIVGVPEKFLTSIQTFFGDRILKVDLKTEHVGLKHLQDFKVGDKVRLHLNSIFGVSLTQGTVFETSEGLVVVRGYRSKRKGYKIYVGTAVKIEKIDKFDKTIK